MLELQHYKIKIDYDEWLPSPRKWDNIGTLCILDHNESDYTDDPGVLFQEYLERHVENYKEEEWQGDAIEVFFEDRHVVIPVYRYEHSDVVYNTTGFSCKWDSGLVGWIYCTKEKAHEEYADDPPEVAEKKAAEYMKGEIETFSKWANGECYDYTIEKVLKCSCCGSLVYYDVSSVCGYFSVEEAKEQALDELKRYDPKWKNPHLVQEQKEYFNKHGEDKPYKIYLPCDDKKPSEEGTCTGKPKDEEEGGDEKFGTNT